MVAFNCPGCQKRMEFPKHPSAGQKADCPNCHRQVLIPSTPVLFWAGVWLTAPLLGALLGLLQGNLQSAVAGVIFGFLLTVLVVVIAWAVNCLCDAFSRPTGRVDQDCLVRPDAATSRQEGGFGMGEPDGQTEQHWRRSAGGG